MMMNEVSVGAVNKRQSGVNNINNSHIPGTGYILLYISYVNSLGLCTALVIKENLPTLEALLLITRNMHKIITCHE